MNASYVFDLGIFLAAAGITMLELAEASAVGLTLYAEQKDSKAFLFVSLGVLVVLIPTALVGNLIALLPITLVRVLAATLLLYFGIRLTRSARRAVLRSRQGSKFQASHQENDKGLMSTGFSVGAIEAFEAAIVLVALLPNNYTSTIYGLLTGIAVVIIATYSLRTQVRKVKQASMKVVVAALLLSFSLFWYSEVAVNISDLALIPLFIVFFFIVRGIANRGVATTVTPQTSTQPDTSDATLTKH
ncbi:MAG: hypothetical protein M1357_00315 [Candidatus Marsarchaeota archaeon]|nr:hypothetical protein [Candidatus Marsarchaeota archaeon]